MTESKKCTWPDCRRVAAVLVGRQPRCEEHMATHLATTKKKSVSISAKPGDKKGQAAMKNLLSALSGRKVDY